MPFPRKAVHVVGLFLIVGFLPSGHEAPAASSVSHHMTQGILLAAIPAPDQIKPELHVSTLQRSSEAPSQLRCDGQRNPVGVAGRHPMLTWLPPQNTKLLRETDYQIEVADSRSGLAGGQLVWNSGKVADNSILFPQYNGPALKPFTQYYFRVRIWSQSGWKSHWSRIGRWTTGILHADQWHGSWISYQPHISNPFYSTLHNAYYGLPLPKKIFHRSWIQKQPSPIFRRVFRAPTDIRHAYLYVSVLGYGSVRINGHSVGRSVLHSTLYDYSKSVPYRSYSVSHLLRPGRRNVITIALGNGWYNVMERDIWGWQTAPWRGWPRARLNLLMQKRNGRDVWVATNSSWQAAAGPCLADGVYNGEVYDEGLKISGWNNPRRRLIGEPHAKIVSPPAGRVFSQLMPPCRIMHTYAPVSIREPQPHVFVVKFPINMSGWVTLQARGRAGIPVVLRYGERLFPNGLVNRNPIAVFAYTGPFQTDTIIPANNQPFSYHPQFAYNGFQYVQIDGLQSEKDIIRIRADFIHTAFPRIGRFWCANPLLNAIADATTRGYCSNFMGYPTDCPTREKNGWAGDAWLASVLGMLSYNNLPGYANWLNDIHDTQYPDGALRVVMPDPSGWDWDSGQYPDPDWESAYEFITWNTYRYFGDGLLLHKYYHGLSRYLHYVLTFAPHGILPNNAGIGDWASSARHVPSIPFTSTCILYHDLVIMRRMADVLHRIADARHFQDRATFIRRAFNKRFYKGGGQYENGGQTAEAMPLYYGLVPARSRAAVVHRLVTDVHAHQDHLAVGILGDKCLFRVLSRYGHTALAYKMATQTTYPSYGQWIIHGATTLWEAWGLDPSSMNHIMFGDILGWMYNDLAGLRPDWRSPGFRTILIRPHPIRALPWAMAEHESQFGLIKSAWRWEGPKLLMQIRVPPCSTAIIRLPKSSHAGILCNVKILHSNTPGVLSLGRSRRGPGDVMLRVSPGRYRIQYVPGNG